MKKIEYHHLKNVEQFLAFACFALFLGARSRQLFIPSAFIILCTTFSMFYLFLGFSIFKKEAFEFDMQKRMNTPIQVPADEKTPFFISRMASFVFPTGILSILFMSLYWPGSEQLLNIAFVGSVVLFAASFYFYQKTKLDLYREIYIRALIQLGFLIFVSI